jgi:hypothetical protein
MRGRALREYKSQAIIITEALTLFPVVYALNGIRAGMPGRLCEAFREVRFNTGLDAEQKNILPPSLLW